MATADRGVTSRAVPLALVLLLVVAFTSAAAGASTRAASPAKGSAGCRRSASKPGVSEETLRSGGVTRRFQLTLPDDYDGRTPLPVVLALHPLSIDYHAVEGITGLAALSSKHPFITVAPSGLLDTAPPNWPFWLAAPVRPNYDVEFLGDLLDRLEATLCVDATHIFSTGISNGGQMSSLLACRLPNRFAAVAPVSGVEFFPQCRGRPVPVVAFHGTDDPIVKYDGGGLNATAIADMEYWKGDVPKGLPVHHGVDAAMQAWAAHNGCDPEPVEQQVSPEVRKRTWRQCDADTVLYIVVGGGHGWPGRPVPAFEAMFGHMTTEIDASSIILDFFLGEK